MSNVATGGDACVILSACRTPIGAFGGVFKEVTAATLGATVVSQAISRAGLEAAAVDAVILGCVNQAGAGMNVARQAALAAGLPETVPGETVNRVCGSGLQAVIHAAQAIRCGDASVVVAGGTESMSGAPYLLPGARWGQRMGHGAVLDSNLSEGLTCSINHYLMGVTAENIAERHQISRVDQDAFAAESQRRTQAAVSSNAFVAEIVPVEVVEKKQTVSITRDEHPRPDTTAERLAGLKPAFKKDGSVTAGNSSGVNDGAAAVIVVSEKTAEQQQRAALARIVSYAVTGVDPSVMGIGPVSAVKAALQRAGLQLGDIDLFELNEAFAAQSLAVVRGLGIDADRVNVNGGAIALGHPIGASGARVLTTLIYALRARQARLGVAALCIGGGMGIAMVIERL